MNTAKVDTWRSFIGIVLTLITLTAGAVLWASNAHMDIKDWTAEQDYVTKQELKDVIKEQYVPRHEFAIVQEKLEENERQHQALMEMLDKIDRKIDKIQRK